MSPLSIDLALDYGLERAESEVDLEEEHPPGLLFTVEAGLRQLQWPNV